MSGSPTVGNRELTELLSAGLVSPETCRAFLGAASYRRRPRRLSRLCRRILRNPANQEKLRDQVAVAVPCTQGAGSARDGGRQGSGVASVGRRNFTPR